MMTFDGSARELCTARRIRTNTPLQALVTLNDSVYVEASAHLAQRMIASASDTRAQIKNGFLFALGHEPSDAELDVLMALQKKVSPDDAMSLVATAILNLDEFITKN